LQLNDWRAIYRHAHAAGLFKRRRRTFRCALEHILERSDEVNLTAAGFVTAIRAYASLNDAGDWTEPPKRIIVTNEYVRDASQPPSTAPAKAAAAPANSPVSNRQSSELELELTRTKQTEEEPSNRQ
jgi:hypothetical protein